MNALICKGFHFYEGDERWLARGVTYGPFRPNDAGDPFPDAERIAHDFALMARHGINAVRLYHVPPESLAQTADEHGLRLLIDIPWPKHLDVYSDPELQATCLRMTSEGVHRLKSWPNLAGVMLGNEIPADLTRWRGARRVESFLRRLYERGREIAPSIPFGYANFPSTEFLQPEFFDFLGFNVYLHDPAVLRNYLIRLRHLHPDKPLLLTEIGMDTQGESEAQQAQFLAASLQQVYAVGAAGAFVFSWTDEWHTGGYDIREWSFGLVERERRPKPALDAVASVFESAPQCAALKSPPKVSVVVATYNGGRTLRECLRSLERLRYPDCEIVVVDDGSTDDTPAILEDFPNVRVVAQENRGLSAARNAGVEAARGEIVAFTDSDCFVDPDWLYHLVLEMKAGGFSGIGGPNLTPESDSLFARCVGLAPGHATHVLLDANEAEHVPGCNMAFRREALLEIGGFDPAFRKAGDDVDAIWRLQDMGHRIGFSTAGFVWHHRRQEVKGYLKQQMGYGEAEAMLMRKHPHRFNDRGQSLWRGRIYAGETGRSLFRRPQVHHGVFGSSAYQCIYYPPAGGLSHAVGTVEWWAGSLLLLLAGLFSDAALYLGLAGVVVSAGAAGIRAWRAWRRTPLCPAAWFPLVWGLWIAQPAVRGAMRYAVRFRTRPPSAHFRNALRRNAPRRPLHFWRSREMRFWGEAAPGRLAVLESLSERMKQLGWLHIPNTEWQGWDLSIMVSWCFGVQLTTAEEDHGAGRLLLMVRLRMMPTSLLLLAGGAGAVLCAAVALQSTLWARLLLLVLLAAFWAVYRHALYGRSLIEELTGNTLEESGYLAMEENSADKRSRDEDFRPAPPVEEP